MRRAVRTSFILLLLFAIASCKPRVTPTISPSGMVVCGSAPACDVGAGILTRGGNAVDAAVATAFALAVTHPSAGNIAGGGFMLVRAPDGRTTSFDYREKAPRSSTRTMYLRGGRIDISLTNEGYLAPGVPGTVRGLALAHKRFGTLPWRDLVMPAVTLADGGFDLTETLARGLNRQIEGVMGHYPASVEAYGKPGGGKWAAGDRIVLKDLARTLRAIAEDGPDAFYTGWIADRIDADMRAHGGLITKEDLAAYEPKERTPVRGRFHDYDVISMPPPSSGGIALIEMLNILEPFHLNEMGRGSADAMHLEIEAMRRAYLDRARFLGDPDFVDVPERKLLSKEYARTLSGSIDPAKATRSVDLGADIVTRADTESKETTHFSVIDSRGMAVANTYTLEGGFGSRVVVKGAGFLLNNEMGDFNKNPGVTNTTGNIGTPANLIDPGKRMLSSMTPTIVERDGKVVLITGSPGDRTIINTVLSVVLGVTEFGMTVREAVDAPRLHHQWLPDSARIETNGASEDVLRQLRAMGHTVTMEGTQGDANSIGLDASGRVSGANDLRNPEGKVSVAGAGLTSARSPQ